MATTPRTPTFQVTTTGDVESGETLLVGQTNLGMVGLSCVDYLIEHLDSTQVGHVTARNVPDVTPFEDGEPRQAVRLYDVEDHDLTILISEVFVPVWATDPFVDAILDWTTDHEIAEMAIMYGVPYPHAPTEHEVFYVATPEYRESRLDDTDISGMRGGFLDGGNVGEFVSRSLEGEAVPVGVYLTPSHPPGPDLEAALRMLDALEAQFEFDIDQTELRERAEEMRLYFSQLATRLDELESGEASLGGQDVPEDMMYM